MDVLAHGLWGGMLAGWRRRFGLAFLFGAAPDMLSFGPWIALRILEGNFQRGKPPLEIIPEWVHTAYAITHSLPIAVPVWAFLWRKNRALAVPFSAWIIHIIMDIPTHSKDFFPTPFLYPLSGFMVDGISWGKRWFMLLNYSCLLAVAVFFAASRRRRGQAGSFHFSSVPDKDSPPQSLPPGEDSSSRST